MTPRVGHVERRSGASAWGASAIFPVGVWPKALVEYAAAYAGDGAELTGLQVIDEFERLSGPIVLSPLPEVGLAYDALLTAAFERDAELSLGAGWPPVVIGFDAGAAHDPRRLVVTNEDVGNLARDPSSDTVPVGARGAGLVGGGFGAATGALAGVRLDAFVLGDRIAVLVAAASLDAHALRSVARAALGELADGVLTLAVSTGPRAARTPMPPLAPVPSLLRRAAASSR